MTRPTSQTSDNQRGLSARFAQSVESRPPVKAFVDTPGRTPTGSHHRRLCGPLVVVAKCCAIAAVISRKRRLRVITRGMGPTDLTKRKGGLTQPCVRCVGFRK